jgi:hypothetical protein
MSCGESRIRTYEGISQQIYSLPQLATLVSPLIKQPVEPVALVCVNERTIHLRADGGIRTPDQLITNQLLWPLSYIGNTLQNRFANV